MQTVKTFFGKHDGKDVFLFSFANKNGYQAQCVSYGATLKALFYPGAKQSAVMCPATLGDMVANQYYMGCVAGPTAGRIKNAAFTLAGKAYKLDANEGPNNLHGGARAYHNTVWEGEIIEGGVIFKTNFKAGFGGYPGNVAAEVRYLLTDDNELVITFRAATDAPTLFNPASHAYFNLDGDQSQGVLGHHLQVNAAQYLQTDGQNIPTGAKLPVAGTEYDFRAPAPIARAPALDNAFCLNSARACTLTSANGKRSLSVEDSRNGLVVYAAGKFGGWLQINGVKERPNLCIALEAQTLPDAINHPDFGDITLLPGAPKEYKTIFKMQETL